jgi:hypothetical protein
LVKKQCRRHTAKRSSSRLASSKLPKILIARRGEVLLMRRFAAIGEATSDLNGVFNPGVSRGNADVVLDMFPSLKKTPGEHQEGVLVV